MKIYDLNKIESDEVRELLINSLPKRVKTLDGATLITSKNIIANEIKSPIIHLNDHKFTNPITISNIEIKNNFIIGDISLGTYNPHFNNYNSPDGSCSAVDLRKTNKYQIFFKPAFETSLGDDGELEIIKFKTFSTLLMDKATFREERLDKLLKI